MILHRTRRHSGPCLCLCHLKPFQLRVCLFEVFLGELEVMAGDQRLEVVAGDQRLEVVEGLDQRLEVVEGLEGQGKMGLEGADLQQEVH